jgi:hypothetical protein
MLATPRINHRASRTDGISDLACAFLFRTRCAGIFAGLSDSDSALDKIYFD